MIIASYDFGTTGCKTSFFDEKGPLIATAYQEYPTHFPQPGWVEQEPDDWKRALVCTTQELLAKSNIHAADIACLSFSGHMMGCVPVDHLGRPISSRAMLWADTRSQPQAQKVEEAIGWERFYGDTGGGLELVMYPAAKIPWIKENQPEIYRKAAYFVGTKDTICAWLTGRIATDYSEASDIGLLHLIEKRWHGDFLDELGIDSQKMPELLESTAVIGKIQKRAAHETGLMEGTPVVIGGGDVSCGTAGAGAVLEDVPYMCIGSAGWVSVAKRQPIIDRSARPMSLCHVVPDMFCSQIIMYSAGVAYKWLRDEVFTYQSPETAVVHDPEAFQKMDALAAQSPAGANGVLFLPYMRPGGAPHYDPSARGAFVGLSLTTKKSDLLRAVMEGVAYNIQLMVQSLEGGNIFPNIRIIGGGSESQLWKQIFADVLQKDVLSLTAQQEANTVGAALVGGVGIGLYEDFAAIDRFSQVKEVTHPQQKIRPYTGKVELPSRDLIKVLSTQISFSRENHYKDQKYGNLTR
jgi:xylulokinase